MIFPGCVIEKGAVVQYAIVDSNVVVRKNAKIGGRPENAKNKDDLGLTVVGSDTDIKENSVVLPKEMI